ncbi:MAG: PKD domain-containing protein, partial [Bacteroidales bacterium]|nr:PKD domain-containing protein [Bacteroidales bacterium]
MRNTFIILGILWMAIGFGFTNNLTAQTACCPEFNLKDAVEVCPPEGACSTNPVGAPGGLTACKGSAHTYTVYPNDPAYTYTWNITGGAPGSYSGNPNTIVWGSGGTGYIKIIISNIGSGGTCVDSIMHEICLIDGPLDDFILSADTVCLNTPVSFTNISAGGSSFTWDFSDGTTSSLTNPPDHMYDSPGTYVVTLTAADMGAGRWVIIQNPPSEVLVPCGCTDTITKIVVVLPGNGPVIDTDCCFGTLCPGDTSSFCTPAVCTTYNWNVTGGSIISGAGSDCITVVWNTVYSGPTTVSLTLPGCGAAPCPGITTIEVPVLYPDLPVTGPSTLCAGASGSYSLPSLPGTYYNWSVSGGPYTFNLKDRNTTDVNITFHSQGTYWVKCDYNNPLAGCYGIDSIQVNVLPELFVVGDDVACEGNTTIYFANGPANWSVTPAGPVFTGNGTATINVTWTTGTYTISATPVNTANFCNSIATKNVEVIAKPILANIIGSDSICPGKNFTYGISSNTTGQQFVWSISGGTGIILSEMGTDKDSVVVNWTGVGPWQLSVYQEIEISPGVFCQSLTKTFDINSFLPPVISGNAIVCADAVETYTAGGSNSSGNFLWSVSPSGQGTIQSGQGTNSVTVLWHGPSNTATLSVTSCSGSDSFPVTINAPAAAVASYNILPLFCLGDIQTLILSTPTTGGYSYQWYQNGTPIPLATSSTLSINISGFTIVGTYQYYVEVTQNGCTVISNIIDVVIEDCSPGGGGGPPGPGGCDAVAFFRAYVVCDQITLVNKSYAVPPATITGYLWTITGPGTGTFTPNANDPSPGLTVSAS